MREVRERRDSKPRRDRRRTFDIPGRLKAESKNVRPMQKKVEADSDLAEADSRRGRAKARHAVKVHRGSLEARYIRTLHYYIRLYLKRKCRRTDNLRTRIRSQK